MSELVLYDPPPTLDGWRGWLRRCRGFMLQLLLPTVVALLLLSAPIWAAVSGLPALWVGVLGTSELCAYGAWIAWRAEP